MVRVLEESNVGFIHALERVVSQREGIGKASTSKSLQVLLDCCHHQGALNVLKGNTIVFVWLLEKYFFPEAAA